VVTGRQRLRVDPFARQCSGHKPVASLKGQHALQIGVEVRDRADAQRPRRGSRAWAPFGGRWMGSFHSALCFVRRRARIGAERRAVAEQEAMLSWLSRIVL
jgi:hypothetical protein